MSKERTRRYRERINQDEVRREEILRDRRRKYHEKKAKGEITARNISCLPKQQKGKLREQWRKAKARSRKREKDLAAILNDTPPSPEGIDMPYQYADALSPPREPSAHGSPHNHTHQRTHECACTPLPHTHPSSSRATSPPAPSLPATNPGIIHQRRRTHKSKLRAKMKRLERENKKLKASLDAKRKAISKMRVQKHRWNKERKMDHQTMRRPLKKKAAAEKKNQVIAFLSRDENSRLLAGKKDTVGRKHKMQRRILSKTLMELHSEYQQECRLEHRMSYRQFVRYKPKYITEARASDRNTCACYQHENIRLLIECLVHKGLLSTKSLSNLLCCITCNSDRQQCMYRQCTDCCFEEVQLNTHTPSELTNWEQWQREEVTVGEKIYKNWVKKRVSGTLGQLAETFQHDLESIAAHQFNWKHQAEKFREIKEKMQENDLVLHIDFSENYACKLNSEIQAFHFGGNRQQATIHTVVAYTKKGSESYATISKSLRHDERAVWAHVKPVIEDLQNQHGTQFQSLHIISDGPVTQYRNKANCFLMSTVPFNWGFKSVTWNYSERGHGKGAPDGVGASVKRMADKFVLNGNDLQTPEALFDLLSTKDETKIKIKWIEEKDIEEFDKLLPPVLPAVKGILNTHQIFTTSPGQISHRSVSCFCNSPRVCSCFKVTKVTMACHSTAPNQEASSVPPLDEDEQDVLKVGQFIIVKYDDKRYVGQIWSIHGDGIQVNCMAQHGQKNVFRWPEKEDSIYYTRADIIGAISEPEPCGRAAKLLNVDWLMFNF